MMIDVPPAFFFFFSLELLVCTHSDGVMTLRQEGAEVGFSVQGAGGK